MVKHAWVAMMLAFVVPGCTGGGFMQIGSSCQTQAAKPQQGRCVPVSKCPLIKHHLLRLQFRSAEMFEAFLTERACSYGVDGTLHICCTSTLNTNHPKRLPANEKHGCREACIPLEDCPTVYGRSIVLQKRYDRSLHQQLRTGFCHELPSGQLFVCCDPERFAVQDRSSMRHLGKRVRWQSCTTPFGDPGKCVPPIRCPMVNDPDTIHSELEAFKIGCDPVGNRTRLCCTKSYLQFGRDAGIKCDTDAGTPGVCTESERCLDFTESTDQDAYVRGNWCYTNLRQVDFLCCASDRLQKVPQVKIVSRLGEVPVPCTTPINRAGFCVSLADCEPIARLLRQISERATPVTPDEGLLLRNSLCDTPAMATGYHVCCDATAVKIAPTPPAPVTAPTPVSTDPLAAGLLGHSSVRLFDRNTCGLPGTVNKIAFGQKARLFQYPWMAMIIYASTAGTEASECAGTIINVRYVLTAAHCIDGQMERLRYVRIGEYDTRTDPDCEDDTCAAPIQLYGVEEAISNPNFTRIVRSGHDIGLMRLNRSIDFSSGDVAPVCLPFTSGLMEFDPTLYWIAGWGLTERLEVSPVLLQARIPPVSCSLSSYAICAGFGNATLHCEGDSGGPMKAQVPEYNFRYVQYGVISAGPRCGGQGVPGISSRVSYFMQWILDNIRE